MVRGRRSAPPGSQSNSEKKHRSRRTALYRPTVPQQIPRRIPDEKYAEVFAGLRSPLSLTRP